MLGKPLANLTAAEPGNEKQLHAVRLDVDAISVAAGLEGNDSHGSIVPQVIEEGKGDRVE